MQSHTARSQLRKEVIDESVLPNIEPPLAKNTTAPIAITFRPPSDFTT